MEKLAIHGGLPAINYEIPKYNTIGKEEKEAVAKVLESGILSEFIGVWNSNFLGGPKVKELESLTCEIFDVENAISVNSWTSGLICAIGALDIEPGDEIILPTWTMSACAMAILHWNAIPVFADIDKRTFNISVDSIKERISEKTKAIMVVDIFGQSSDIDLINSIAKPKGIVVITDCAQSPGAKYKGKYAGTLTDIGGFSLNFHKHIHCGEGGLIVTNNSSFADRMRLIRNHAESAIAGSGRRDLNNMLGYNFRLGEIESAIAIEQLKKLENLVQVKSNLGARLLDKLKDLPGLSVPFIPSYTNHVYYVFPLVIDTEELGVPRRNIYKALATEGVPSLFEGYQNLHLLPAFKNKIAYGNSDFPWSINEDKNYSYNIGDCPIAEELHSQTLIGLGLCVYDFNEKDIDAISLAFEKVWSNLSEL